MNYMRHDKWNDMTTMVQLIKESERRNEYRKYTHTHIESDNQNSNILVSFRFGVTFKKLKFQRTRLSIDSRLLSIVSSKKNEAYKSASHNLW